MDILNKASGFLGLTGDVDSRDVERRYQNGDDKAALAIDLFCYRLAKYVAAYSVSLGGLDAVVFTGGIGEKSSIKRAKVMEFLAAPFGFVLDPERNQAHGRSSRGIITADGSPRVAIVVAANEELVIAQEVLNVINEEETI